MGVFFEQGRQKLKCLPTLARHIKILRKGKYNRKYWYEKIWGYQNGGSFN